MKMHVLAMLLLLAGFVAAQEINTTISNVTNETEVAANASEGAKMAVDVRYDIVSHGYNKTLAAMDSVIAYFTAQGKNVTELTELRNNFSTLYVGLDQYVTARDPSGFGKQVAEMHKVAAKFKAETARLASPGQMGELSKLVRNSTEAKLNESAMVALKERIRGKKAALYLNVSEINAGRLAAFIEKAKAQNISVADLEGLLVKLRAKIAVMNRSMNETELNLRVAEVKELFIEIDGNTTEVARAANERAMVRAIAVVSALENKGVNVSGVKEKLQIVSQIKEEARTACAANITSAECKEKISEMREEIGNISKNISVIVKNATARVVVKQAGKGRE